MLLYDAADAAQAKKANETTLERKIREARYALTLDKTMSKDDILTGYFNIAFFGERSYGIGAAAEHYFGVPATPAQPGPVGAARRPRAEPQRPRPAAAPDQRPQPARHRARPDADGRLHHRSPGEGGRGPAAQPAHHQADRRLPGRQGPLLLRLGRLHAASPTRRSARPSRQRTDAAAQGRPDHPHDAELEGRAGGRGGAGQQPAGRHKAHNPRGIAGAEVHDQAGHRRRAGDDRQPAVGLRRQGGAERQPVRRPAPARASRAARRSSCSR